MEAKTNHQKMLAQLRVGCDLVIHYTLVEWFLINIEMNERIVVGRTAHPHMVHVIIERSNEDD